MPSRESWTPAPMERVAVVAPRPRLRGLLAVLASRGRLELDAAADGGRGEALAGGGTGAAAGRLGRVPPGTRPAVSLGEPDVDGWAAAGRWDLVAGEALLERVATQALDQGSVVALTGWLPLAWLAEERAAVARLGASIVVLPHPRTVEPPTLLGSEPGAGGEFQRLMDVYGTVPYRDLNPSLIAGVVYLVMFGVMFADAGHGALLVLVGLLARRRAVGRVARLRPVWLMLVGAGGAGMLFGALFGEFFGPTGVLPVLWLEPLEQPMPLLAAAIGAGVVLLAGSYLLGTVNRYREGGWPRALWASSGAAGAAVFAGLLVVVAGVWSGVGWMTLAGAALATLGLAAVVVGVLAEGDGGAAGARAGVESFDLVVRILSNVVSFARLGAFGLTHAALGAVVWDGATGLAGAGPAGLAAGVVLFLAGNLLAFLLEGLVAAVQALRLEYYELFSRVFETQGRPFRPWSLAVSASSPSGDSSVSEVST